MANATIKQNETFRVSLKLRDEQSGMALDLTDCTAYSQMRRKPGDDLIATATCTINAEKGIIDVLWTSDQTADFPLGVCGYDVWLIFPNNNDSYEQKAIYTDEITVIQPYTENVGD